MDERRRNIHVCHVTTSHPVRDVRIFHRECRGLARKGFKVTLIARGAASEELDEDGVRIVPVKFILGRLGRKFILPKVAVGKARKLDADVYHFHDPELLPWMCLLAKQHGAKVVWDVHELYPATISEFHVTFLPPLAHLLGMAFTYLERLWCAAFAAVVAVTDPIRDRYVDMGMKCETIHNVIDLNGIPEIRCVEKEPFFTIVASGTTNASRCVDQLIDAFAIVSEKHPKTILRLFAQFESKKDEWRVRRRLIDKGVAGKTKISPLIPWNRLLGEELPKAHVGMVLYARSGNNFVGVPNRLFEYWTSRLPVIATDTPILRKMVNENDAGLIVDSTEPALIAKAICHYVETPEEGERQGRNGRQAVLEKYNWEHDLKKLCRLYEEILKNDAIDAQSKKKPPNGDDVK